ncbi:MAG: efflux RND transporter permease subunit [Paracoccaceae bacterium]
MKGLVTWATNNARMIMALIVVSVVAGVYSYSNLPKEGEPDISVPFLFVSVPYPGISAEDSEKLLVRPLETVLSDVTGLKRLSATAAENYAGIVLEFALDWNRESTLADVRDKMSTAVSSLPEDVGQYTINEMNFAEFPVLVISLSGNIPERSMLRVAKDLQSEVESISGVLEANISGQRDEMLEVLISPLKMEAYNVTVGELLSVVRNNNRLIAAGEVSVGSGAYSIKIPSAFDDPQDVYGLPVKRNGDSVVTLGQLADIRLTFEDRAGTARYNGETTVALQIVKRKGANLISTVAGIREAVDAYTAAWPADLQQAVTVSVSMDNSINVKDMVSQLEASVLTAIALVMIVVLASLGIQSALLVGFAIPTSFLLTFAMLSLFGISISNIVMFGLILAVGMLVDGAIVVVEYADKEIKRGIGPMRAYNAAATRMFWPIVSSTATTLCAFMPMLFWPGIPGQFMRNLPITLIFVLSASLVVALIFLPVVGGLAGRISGRLELWSKSLHPVHLILRLLLTAATIAALVAGIYVTLTFNLLAGGALTAAAMMLVSVTIGAFKPRKIAPVKNASHQRTWFGHFTNFISGNPVMPVVSLLLTAALVAGIFMTFQAKGKGIEFFVQTEPERAIAYVRARGNLSLEEKDRMVREVENAVINIRGVESIFAFGGGGGLSQNTGGAVSPGDAIGQVQIELVSWNIRDDWGDEGKGAYILQQATNAMEALPGIKVEILEQTMGPASAKPVKLRITGGNWNDMLTATAIARARFDVTEGLTGIDDTMPLPGIDWQINVDVQQAGRYGTDVASVGGMIQLVTRGLQLGTMRTDSSDDEVAIRVRFPEGDRVLSTIDTLRIRTPQGLVPLSNFVTREAVPKIAKIDRSDTERFFDIKAGVALGVNANEKIAEITEWLETENPLPASVNWEFTGDAEDQAESLTFLAGAGVAAMAMMFIILLAQFNSFYNAVLVLLAVVLSTAGVLVGMMVMGQAFSVIMTGTGIVALAGIVVNNNIVLIDTYQEYSKYMPKLEAIPRTAQQRIRPVLLTTITTMAGLAPMMFGLSLDFINGGYSFNTPTSLWWKQLATAVVFGLGFATMLTLIVTPALLALRIWVANGAYSFKAMLATILLPRAHPVRRDLRLKRAARNAKAIEINWEQKLPELQEVAATPSHAAE